MKEKLYLSRPALVCAAGMNLEQVWKASLNADNSCIHLVKPKFGEKSFYAARISDAMLADCNSRLQQKIIRIEEAALVQLEPFVKEAVALYGADRIAVCVGSCDNGSELSVAAHSQYFNSGSFPKDYTLEMQGADYVASYVSERFGIKGPSCAFASACSSSLLALNRAASLILSNMADGVIVGGVDIASDTVLLGFDSLEAVSDEPCNPFSRNRKGITLGDGAAFFLLTKDYIFKDEAKIVLAGFGESADAFHLTSPEPNGTGASAAIKSALDCAGISASKIDYLALHGTGTKLNDAMEAKVVNEIFGKELPCSSIKSIVGHTLGAAGAISLALCYAVLTKNYDSESVLYPCQAWDNAFDESIPKINIVSKGTKFNLKELPHYCMANAFAFGGSNECAIICRE